jgi:radical SAM superfamily enzyme YgiQ (UPF0313 family)
MLDILFLTHPGSTYAVRPHAVAIPLGLLMLAAVTNEKNSLVYDAAADAFSPNGELRPEEKSWQRFKDFVAKNPAKIVALSSSFSAVQKQALRALTEIRTLQPDSFLIVGGFDATVDPNAYLSGPTAADAVCLGESERSFPLIVERVLTNDRSLQGIDAIAWRKDDTVVINPRTAFITNLDTLPLPAYDKIDLERYFTLFENDRDFWRVAPFDEGHRKIPMITSRGCPHQCSFCAVAEQSGKLWRAHSASYVLAHIKTLVERYRVRHISFEDDNISLDRTRFAEILRGMISMGSPVSWATPNGTRADKFDDKIADLCVKSRCANIRFAIESGSAHTRNTLIGKALSTKDIFKAAKTSHRHKLDCCAFYIVGLPHETFLSVLSTVSLSLWLLLAYDIGIIICVFRFLPKTKATLALKEKPSNDAAAKPEHTHIVSKRWFRFTLWLWEKCAVALCVVRQHHPAFTSIRASIKEQPNLWWPIICSKHYELRRASKKQQHLSTK